MYTVEPSDSLGLAVVFFGSLLSLQLSNSPCLLYLHERLPYVSKALFLDGYRLETVILLAFWDSRYCPILILSLLILRFSSSLGKLSSGWLLVL